jgi:hypothetical protein
MDGAINAFDGKKMPTQAANPLNSSANPFKSINPNKIQIPPKGSLYSQLQDERKAVTPPSEEREAEIVAQLGALDKLALEEAVPVIPTFAEALAASLAQAKDVLYVHAGWTERLEVSETTFLEVTAALQDWGMQLALDDKPSPSILWASWSVEEDRGTIGVATDEDAVMIVAGVKEVRLSDNRIFRAWRRSELTDRHLVTIPIPSSIAAGGAERAIKGLMAYNRLAGKCNRAGISRGNGSELLLRFHADDEMYQSLLDRRGDNGRRLMLKIGLSNLAVHLSRLPGVAKKELEDRRARTIADLKALIETGWRIPLVLPVIPDVEEQMDESPTGNNDFTV